jgi:hypothetical protein
MELAGDEKRIQALFSELSLAEAQRAPRFEQLWREALLTKQAPRFGKSLVLVAATVLVAVAILFVAWSRYRSPAQQNAQNQNVQNLAPQTIASGPAQQRLEPEDVEVTQHHRRSHPSRRRVVARQRQSELALQQQAAMLANWKSPTEQFMTSPTGSVFNSLPQLNESVKDLQSFLPKESN